MGDRKEGWMDGLPGLPSYLPWLHVLPASWLRCWFASQTLHGPSAQAIFTRDWHGIHSYQRNLFRLKSGSHYKDRAGHPVRSRTRIALALSVLATHSDLSLGRGSVPRSWRGKSAIRNPKFPSLLPAQKLGSELKRLGQKRAPILI
jgi:hypothetical protein